MSKDKNKSDKLTFEQAIEKLEEIVNAMEQGRIGLEQSIDKYAEGAELIKHCRSVLDSAEKKIRLLTESQGGELIVDGELEDMAAPDDDSYDDDEDDSPF